MRDYIELGSAPTEEECVQVKSGSEAEYLPKMKEECRRYIELLRRTFGEEPEGARFYIKTLKHDFGLYYEVVCYFDDADQEAVNYAFRCEAEAPTRWN